MIKNCSFLLCFALFFSGCAYTTRAALDPEWKTVYVAPIMNKVDFTNASERQLYAPLLEVKLRTAVSEKFVRDGYFKVANQADEADVILKMTFKEFAHYPLRYDLDRNVIEWRVTLIADLEFWDNHRQEVVWAGSFGGSQDRFRLGTKAIPEDAAIEEAVNDLANRVVERAVENW